MADVLSLNSAFPPLAFISTHIYWNVSPRAYSFGLFLVRRAASNWYPSHSQADRQSTSEMGHRDRLVTPEIRLVVIEYIRHLFPKILILPLNSLPQSLLHSSHIKSILSQSLINLLLMYKMFFTSAYIFLLFTFTKANPPPDTNSRSLKGSHLVRDIVQVGQDNISICETYASVLPSTVIITSVSVLYPF